MEPYREIDWSFVIGFGTIGALIVTHLVLSVARGRYFAQGISTFRATQPIAFWFFIGLELLLIALVFGGLYLYLADGGTIVDVPPTTVNMNIKL